MHPDTRDFTFFEFVDIGARYLEGLTVFSSLEQPLDGHPVAFAENARDFGFLVAGWPAR
jgi:hypothetical protein